MLTFMQLNTFIGTKSGALYIPPLVDHLRSLTRPHIVVSWPVSLKRASPTHLGERLCLW